MEDSAQHPQADHEERKEKSQLDLELEAYLSKQREESQQASLKTELDMYLKSKKEL